MHKSRTTTLALLLGLMASAAALAQVCSPSIPASTPTASFVVGANGTATDTQTGLMWKRCAEGQTWNGATCTGTASIHTWQAALQRAKTVNDAGGYAGHADWRLPNVKELRSLVEERCYSPSINGTVFPATPASVFWSASAFADSSGDAWYVYFYYGYADNGFKSNGFQVRLVRAGQSFDAFAGGVCTVGGTVSGRVRDKTTGQVKSGVVVSLGASSTTSAVDGSFSFAAVAAGQKTLNASVPNFAGGGVPVTVCGNTTQDILLTKQETVLGAAAASGYAADPVNTASGNYTFNRIDLKLPGKGIGFAFERGYNSLDALNGPLGFGWTHNYNTSLAVDGGGNVTVRFGDGHTVTFAPNGSGGYVPQYGVFDTLVKEADLSYTLTKKDLSVHRFGADGKLLSMADRNANTILLAYTGGLLTRVTDTAGRNIDFTYDGSARITQLTDPLGRTVLFAYDASDNLISSTDPAGRVTTYTYDANHQMLTATDPRGNVFVSNTYDAALRVVTSQRDAKLGQTTYVYDSVTRKTTITDSLGQVSAHTHDSLLRLIRDDDALGKSQLFTYDTAGNRSTVTDRNGKATAYDYDAAGNVTMKTDALGRYTSITYDAKNNPLTRTDAAGGITAFEYDVKGNLTKTTDALGNIATVTYNAAGLPLTLTDSRGAVTTNGYDAQGNLTSVQDALGNITTHVYDAVGRRLSRTDALGRVTQYAYDANDNVVSVTDPAGKVANVTYDENNNRKTATNRRGQVTSYTYDVKDLLTKTTDALGNVVESAYDALDRPISVKDSRGNITQFGYDAAGRRTSITDALGRVAGAAFDANGNRTGVTDALGHSTSFAYDALNRQVSATDALGNATATAYDALGRVASVTDAKGRVTAFGYDALGRLKTVTDAGGGSVLYAYDANGNRVSMTDPRGNVTVYEYDARNRLTKKTEPSARITLYGYDAVGTLTSLTRPNGSAIGYSYDNRDRLTTVTYPDSTSVAFTYDDNGNRLTMTDALGTASHTYDVLDRLATRTDPFGQTVAYGYDAAGNRTSLTYPGNKIATYAYDALNRMVSVTDWLGRATGYSYDTAGRLTGMSNPNGTSTTLTFDNADRLTGLNNAGPAQTIASYAYTLDPLGNHAQATVNEPLAPAIAAGTVNYSYDNDNRLTSAGGVSFAYDADGNLITKGPDSFVWDAEDRVNQSTIGGVAASYHYDGTGNRLAKTVAGTTTRYVLDLNGSLSKVLMETNSGNAPTAYYLYGFGLVARIKPDGAANYYHYDSRGSTVALTDQTGTVTDAYAYDPFGKVAASQGVTANPYRYVGRYGLMDEGNGVLYVRARYYDPESGRFLSKDSKAGSDTDSQGLHRYIYALNNPMILVDMDGHSATCWKVGIGMATPLGVLGLLGSPFGAVIAFTGGLAAGYSMCSSIESAKANGDKMNQQRNSAIDEEDYEKAHAIEADYYSKQLPGDVKEIVSSVPGTSINPGLTDQGISGVFSAIGGKVELAKDIVDLGQSAYSIGKAAIREYWPKSKATAANGSATVMNSKSPVPEIREATAYKVQTYKK